MYKKNSNNGSGRDEGWFRPEGTIRNIQHEEQITVEGFGRYIKAIRTGQQRTIEEVAQESALEAGLIIALEEGFIPLQEIKPEWVDKIANSLDVHLEKLNHFLDRTTPSSKIQQIIDELRLAALGIMGKFWQPVKKNANIFKGPRMPTSFPDVQQIIYQSDWFHNITNFAASCQPVIEISAIKIAVLVMALLSFGAVTYTHLVHPGPSASVPTTGASSVAVVVTTTPTSTHISIVTTSPSSIGVSISNEPDDKIEQPTSVSALPLEYTATYTPSSQPTIVVLTTTVENQVPQTVVPATATPTLTPTATPIAPPDSPPPSTNTPVPLPTATPAPPTAPPASPTSTPLPTNTPAPTATPISVTATSVPPSSTPSATDTPPPGSTSTPYPTSATPTPTSTPGGTDTPTPTEVPPTIAPTATPQPTNTPLADPTPTPLATATFSPTPTVTPTSVQHKMHFMTMTNCERWEINVSTTPQNAELYYQPAKFGPWAQNEPITVYITAVWSDGTIISAKATLQRPAICSD